MKTLNQASKVAFDSPVRAWEASLNLAFTRRANKTVMSRAAHCGPLRVQRPFYPEQTDCCHVYLLHPPGGMAVGDVVTIDAEVTEKSNTLITTPSAGRIYNTKGLAYTQTQRVNMRVKADACLEWMPQETIVFEGANARLSSRFDIEDNAKLIAWDIVRLGRRDSGEAFDSGSVHQSIEVWAAGKPKFIERNRIRGGDDILNATWGLQAKSTFGTLLATFGKVNHFAI